MDLQPEVCENMQSTDKKVIRSSHVNKISLKISKNIFETTTYSMIFEGQPRSWHHFFTTNIHDPKSHRPMKSWDVFIEGVLRMMGGRFQHPPLHILGFATLLFPKKKISQMVVEW